MLLKKAFCVFAMGLIPGILRKARIWARVRDLLLAQVGSPFARHRQQVSIHDVVIC